MASTLLAALAPSAPLVVPGGAALPDAVAQLGRHDLLALALPGELPERFEVQVTLGGEPVTLALHRRTVRAPTARLLADRGDGALEHVALPPSRTYGGAIAGEPGSAVAASLLGHGLVALIERGDGERFHVEPLAHLADGAPESAHVAYRAKDVVAGGHTCGNDALDVPRAIDVPPRAADGAGGIAGATTYLVELAADADFEYFQKNSGSLALTVADIESVLAQVDFIYSRDVDISYEISTIVVRTSESDPYTATGSSALLCEFRSTWNTVPESQIQREVAHLFTGKNLDGTTIGVGWLGVVCNQTASACSGVVGDLAYSLAESKFTGATFSQRVGLSCHELGHNWGASHCDGDGDCHIMCSSIGSCDGIAGANLKFGAAAAGEIVTYRNSVSCDLGLGPALSLPFSETWPTGAISTATWTFCNGCASVTAATNEPSAPYSLNLDASGAGAYEDDEIRSQAMLLAGASPAVTLSYHTQHVGAESGERLHVEYWSTGGEWESVETIVSNGADQSAFVPSSHVLPANALHDGFRLRFRTEVDEANDEWYVDDIALVVSSTCDADFNVDGLVDATDLAVFIGSWGVCPGCPADLDGSGAVNGQDLTLFLFEWGGCGNESSPP